MAELGTNVSRAGRDEPQDIAALGLRWVRIVAMDEDRLRNDRYVERCHEAGLKVLMVIVRESLDVGGKPNAGTLSYAQAAGRYRERYIENPDPLGNADAWQIGNEPDAKGNSSWTMNQAEYATLLGTFAVEWPGVKLIGAGLVNGHANWLHGLDLSPVHAVAFHPYGQSVPGFTSPYKDPGDATVEKKVEEFGGLSSRVWVTEFGVKATDVLDEPEGRRTKVVSAYLNRMFCYLHQESRIEVAIQYRWRDGSGPGFGLLDADGKRAPWFEAFRHATLGQEI